MKLDHLAFVTRDLKKAVDDYLGMGFAKDHGEARHHRPKNMFIQRLSLGDFLIEIIQPADASIPSFADEALAASGAPVALHHICYAVDDIRKTVDVLMASGAYEICEQITEAVFQDSLLCFLRHERLGLIELFQKRGDATPSVDGSEEGQTDK